MFINAFTKEFTFVNDVIKSYKIAFEHLLTYAFEHLLVVNFKSDIIIDRALCNYMT